MIFFRQYAESFHLRNNTVSYFLPARHPGHIMGTRVPLGCDLNFEFLVGVHNNTLLVLGEIHRSRSIILHKGESNDAINAPFMWTRIEPKAENLVQLIESKVSVVVPLRVAALSSQVFPRKPGYVQRGSWYTPQAKSQKKNLWQL